MKRIPLLSLVFLLTLLFTSCNKDDVIEDPTSKSPVITLDNETGIYSVKIGHELSITPEVRNADGAIFTWLINGKLVSTSQTLTISFDSPQDVYATFRVETLVGTAEEEIKIEVVEAAPPSISLAVPSCGLQILVNSEYTFIPIINNKGEGFRCKWILDDEIVCNEESYTFPKSQLGKYSLTIEASNEDGITTRTYEIEVVEKLPYVVEFPSLSYFSSVVDRSAVVGRPVFLRPIMEYIDLPSYEWYINGKLIPDATERNFKFTPDKAGDYIISLKVTNGATGEFIIAETTVHVFTSQGNIRTKTATSKSTQNHVYEFLPAPGQFVNETQVGGYTSEITTHEKAIEYAYNRLENRAYVSLGSFGGYIIIGFDHSIVNGGKQYDFAIQGNAFNSTSGGSNEPGIVYVMQDTNGNGLPDDEWYELRACETGASTTNQFYEVTYFRPGSSMSTQWIDSEGNNGRIEYLPQYHNQEYYYPIWIEASSYTLRGTKIRSNNTIDHTTGYWANNAFDWGYVDNVGTDNLEGADSWTGAGQRNGFKISNAILPDGTPIELSHIDFIKVQTAVLAQSGALGENSTEVFSFIDLSMD